MAPARPLSIVQWNARGIRQKRSWLGFPPFFVADVLVIQESFLHTGDSFSWPRRNIYRKDRVSRGGGLLTAVSSSIPSSVVLLDGLDSPDVEELTIRIWTGNQWVTIVNIYARDGKVGPVWLTSLLRQLVAPFLILGDFNQHHSAWGCASHSPGSDQLYDWILHNDICLLNTSHATHIAPSGTLSLIDLSLASPDVYRDCTTLVHHDPFGSDHFPIAIQLDGTACSVPRFITHVDWTSVQQAMNVSFQDADCPSVDSLQAKLRSLIKAHSSRVTVRSKGTPPWWNSECAWLLGQKRRYLRLSRLHLSKPFWILYRQFSARLKRCMKTQARAYWGTLCENARSQKIYQIFKALHTRSTDVHSHLVLDVDGQRVADRAAQARFFAAHFGQSRAVPGIPFDLSGSDDFWNQDFTMLDLQAAIRATNNTSPGEDSIPAKAYKSLNIDNRSTLLNLCNRSLHTGVIPRSWRTAIIVPIWKQGKPKSQVGSYRPIALTAVGGKIMERMILKRLLDWIITHKSFHSRHFGFLPGKDCTKALMTLYNDIHGARRQGKIVVAVKLDINSAYDSVWRDGLVYKLGQLGITGDCALWIANWLAVRWLKVRWRGLVSSPVGSHRGVPQGSVLSPVLFMIFLWDIFEVFDSGVQAVVYADDIVLYFSGVCLQMVLRKLQDALWRIQDWCVHWHLDIRADKCAAICFSRSSGIPENSLRLHGMDIEWTSHMKVLGLTLSYNLTFHAHFRYLQRKCLKRLNVLKAFATPRWGIRYLQFIRLVNALIRGLLEYAAPIYATACPSSLKTLDVLYNSALRTATGLPRWTPIFKLYRESGQVPLSIRRSYLTQAFYIRCARSFHRQDDLVSCSPSDLSWTTEYGVIHPSMLLLTCWPTGWIGDWVDIYVDDFPFQCRSLAPAVLRAAFNECVSRQFPGYHLIATDASKDADKTSIAAVDMTHEVGRARLVHHLNSVFTAEVLAIELGVGLTAGGSCLIVTDSKSALMALRTASQKSPTAVLHLVQTLRTAQTRLDKLALLWVPAHVGIVANEKADTLAKFGPFGTCPFGGISPEDLAGYFKARMRADFEDWWESSNYATTSQYLGNYLYSFTRNRREEVITARLRTLSMPTESRLFKFRLRQSSVCAVCGAGFGSEYHYIFDCRAFAAERALLSHRMAVDMDRLSWNSFWSIMEDNIRLFRLFLDLFLGTGRF